MTGPYLLQFDGHFDVIDSLLIKWFASSAYKEVVIVSPFIDDASLKYLSRVANGHEEKLRVFARNEQRREQTKICEQLPAYFDKERWPQFTLLNRDCAPHEALVYKMYFHAKFIAGLRRDQTVELLVISANFTIDHLRNEVLGNLESRKSPNHDTAYYHELPYTEFYSRFSLEDAHYLHEPRQF